MQRICSYKLLCTSCHICEREFQHFTLAFTLYEKFTILKCDPALLENSAPDRVLSIFAENPSRMGFDNLSGWAHASLVIALMKLLMRKHFIWKEISHQIPFDTDKKAICILTRFCTFSIIEPLPF